ncbi:universal stress protein [Halorientalis salina]|uniref:universal stress protein n=1 Tax=Halorientalis salina TaxID=2932266 RepID=UPI0010ADA3AA|nr:universal stress protein [Halorientalis salina]
MVFLVPFDGSALASTALERAVEFATDQEIIALSVVPSGKHYAEIKGWDTASADGETAIAMLEAEVEAIAEDATFEFVRTESRPPAAKIAKIIRRKADAHDASVVFVGSENAGKRASPVTSISPGITSDESYDVYIARQRKE